MSCTNDFSFSLSQRRLKYLQLPKLPLSAAGTFLISAPYVLTGRGGEEGGRGPGGQERVQERRGIIESEQEERGGGRGGEREE